MKCEDFTVGWICALDCELVAAFEMLDVEYTDFKPEIPDDDDNGYTYGKIANLYVVIAGLPRGVYGVASAAGVARDMRRSFGNLTIRLMVGIAGGAPSQENDVRLGDVVVGCPDSGNSYGGVVQYDHGKAIEDGEFEQTGSMNSPPHRVLNMVTKLSANHKRRGNQIVESVQKIFGRNKNLCEDYTYPGPEHDKLYESSSKHPKTARDLDCDSSCGEAKPRDENRLVVVHYGLIASADQLMKNAVRRDQLIEKYRMLCFEMEAAGLMNDFQCLVIRGICDYSDAHKNKRWQGFAAAAAATYAKELLCLFGTSQTGSGSEQRIPDSTYADNSMQDESSARPYLCSSKPQMNLQGDRSLGSVIGTTHEETYDVGQAFPKTSTSPIAGGIYKHLQIWLRRKGSPFLLIRKEPGPHINRLTLELCSHLVNGALERRLPLVAYKGSRAERVDFRTFVQALNDQLAPEEGLASPGSSDMLPPKVTDEFSTFEERIRESRDLCGVFCGFQNVGGGGGGGTKEIDDSHRFYNILRDHSKRFDGSKFLFVIEGDDHHLKSVQHDWETCLFRDTSAQMPMKDLEFGGQSPS